MATWALLQIWRARKAVDGNSRDWIIAAAYVAPFVMRAHTHSPHHFISLVCLSYLFNPYLLFSTLALSTSPLDNALLLLSIMFACKRKQTLCHRVPSTDALKTICRKSAAGSFDAGNRYSLVVTVNLDSSASPVAFDIKGRYISPRQSVFVSIPASKSSLTSLDRVCSVFFGSYRSIDHHCRRVGMGEQYLGCRVDFAPFSRLRFVC